VDSEQLKELCKDFPKMPLVIKWGMREREICQASDVAQRIHEEEQLGDWVREVFINAENLGKSLRSSFNCSESTKPQCSMMSFNSFML